MGQMESVLCYTHYTCSHFRYVFNISYFMTNIMSLKGLKRLILIIVIFPVSNDSFNDRSWEKVANDEMWHAK